MFDKRLLWTSTAIVIVIMVAVVAAALPQRENAVRSQENVSGLEVEEDTPQQEPEYLYMLKEYRGRIGVYIGGADEPEMILDVPIKHLPDYDRELLMEGIPVWSYSELVALMEDYSS